ncbi:MAG: hypothetical protein ACMXYG_04250 [Candidatus Woesearchaeota archaeon]
MAYAAALQFKENIKDDNYRKVLDDAVNIAKGSNGLKGPGGLRWETRLEHLSYLVDMLNYSYDGSRNDLCFLYEGIRSVFNEMNSKESLLNNFAIDDSGEYSSNAKTSVNIRYSYTKLHLQIEDLEEKLDNYPRDFQIYNSDPVPITTSNDKVSWKNFFKGFATASAVAASVVLAATGIKALYDKYMDNTESLPSLKYVADVNLDNATTIYTPENLILPETKQVRQPDFVKPTLSSTDVETDTFLSLDDIPTSEVIKPEETFDKEVRATTLFDKLVDELDQPATTSALLINGGSDHLEIARSNPFFGYEGTWSGFLPERFDVIRDGKIIEYDLDDLVRMPKMPANVTDFVENDFGWIVRN